MALIRRKQAIFDMRGAFTDLLNAAAKLRELKQEYTDAGLLAQWQANPTDFDEHGFTYSVLVAALDDFAVVDTTANTGLSAKDDNMRKVRN